MYMPNDVDRVDSIAYLCNKWDQNLRCKFQCYKYVIQIADDLPCIT